MPRPETLGEEAVLGAQRSGCLGCPTGGQPFSRPQWLWGVSRGSQFLPLTLLPHFQPNWPEARGAVGTLDCLCGAASQGVG